MAKKEKKKAVEDTDKRAGRRQLDYQNRYNREMYNQYHFRVRKDDKELNDTIAKIRSEGNLSSYLRELIKADNDLK